MSEIINGIPAEAHQWISEGRLCGWCGDDIRTDRAGEPEGDNMAQGTGHGVPTLCAECAAHGTRDPNLYLD